MLKVRLNLRKVVAIAICLVGSATMYAQNNTTDNGVMINGVKWATRNVDAPSTFAAKPEAPGMFYQWNCRIGWSTTAPMVNSNGESKWEDTDTNGNTWAKSNDPSPVGWRVPILSEIKSLLDIDKVINEWTTVNGVTGRKFTDKATGNSLFLPAVGNRDESEGTLNNAGTHGYYWSSTPQDGLTGAYYLFFGNEEVFWYPAFRWYGMSIRSVAE